MKQEGKVRKMASMPMHPCPRNSARVYENVADIFTWSQAKRYLQVVVFVTCHKWSPFLNRNVLPRSSCLLRAQGTPADLHCPPDVPGCLYSKHLTLPRSSCSLHARGTPADLYCPLDVPTYLCTGYTSRPILPT